VGKSGLKYVFLNFKTEIKERERIDRNIRVQGRCERKNDASSCLEKAVGSNFAGRICVEKIGLSALFGIVPHERMGGDDDTSAWFESFCEKEQ
jgi:hypothetical protein